MRKPVLFFDVIETLFSLEPLQAGFQQLGMPEGSDKVFFAQLLRDAFALSATGQFYSFPEIAAASLEVLLESAGQKAGPEQVQTLLKIFSQLPPHPDVGAGLETAQAGGAEVVLLTNGSRHNTEGLLKAGKLTHLVDQVVSIEALQVWKPKPEVYTKAAQTLGVEPPEACLIAAHAWDLQGARQAGLKTVWLRRQDSLYHRLMGDPQGMANTLEEAVAIALQLSA